MCTSCKKCIILSSVLQTDVTEEDVQGIGENLSSESLKLGILYNCLNFALREVIHLETVETFVKVFHNFFQTTVCQGLPIEETLTVLRRKMEELSLQICNPMFLLSCVDYIMSTVIQHYQLMVHAMQNERCIEIHYNDQIVDVLEEILELKDGVEIETWKLDTKLKKEEANFHSKEEELNKTFDGMFEEIQEELEQLFLSVDDMEIAKSLKSTEIIDIITNIVLKQKETAALDIEKLLEKSKSSLQHHLEKIMITNQFKEKSKTRH